MIGDSVTQAFLVMGATLTIALQHCTGDGGHIRVTQNHLIHTFRTLYYRQNYLRAVPHQWRGKQTGTIVTVLLTRLPPNRDHRQRQPLRNRSILAM